MKTIKGRLVLSAILIFLLVSLTSFFLIYGTKLNDYYLQQEQVVEERLDILQQLSVDAYRYFKQVGDILLLGNLTPQSDLRIEYSAIESDLKELFKAYAEPTRAIVPASPATLDRNLAIQNVLKDSQSVFTNLQVVETWEEMGQGWRLLSNLVDEKIDREFRSLIRDSTRNEQQQLDELRQNYKKNAFLLLAVNTILGIVVAIVTLLILYLLYKSIERPLLLLGDGTSAIVAGEYENQIHIDAPLEYAELARRFNSMSEQLSIQKRDLVDSREKLSMEVQRQTLELQQKNLQLEKLDTSRKRLLLDVGHELRTPLTVLQGEVDIALRQKDASRDQLVSALHRISEVTTAINRLVTGLFLIVRSDFDSGRTAFEPLDYRVLLGELFDSCSVLAVKKSIQLSFDIPRDSLPGHGDPYRIKQAMMAIIDNAVRYSDTGGHLEICHHLDGQNLVLDVKDDGIGISTEDSEHVFERFYRSSAAKKHTPHGSGLGLAVAKQIIVQHGGNIRIHSNKNAIGTTVHIVLPLMALIHPGDSE